MSNEAIKRPTVVSLSTLSEGVRVESSRPKRSSRKPTAESRPVVRPYDREVKFITLKSSMNFGTIVRARSISGS